MSEGESESASVPTHRQSLADEVLLVVNLKTLLVLVYVLTVMSKMTSFKTNHSVRKKSQSQLSI